jgi:Na+/H+ antiporter NhaD/arsenite permease-like protein
LIIWLRGEPILLVLVLGFAVLQAVHPQPWARLPGLVDWQTVLTLAGLLMLTNALEHSGALSWLAHRLVARIATERALALLLAALAAALSTVLTNDVALFAVIPLTLSLGRLAPLPMGRLVICIALAVNAGSVLTPFGNPQNLFLWQVSGVSFLGFVQALAPLCAALVGLLLIIVALLFRSRPITLRAAPAAHAVDSRLLMVAAVAFCGFVVAADLHHATSALIVVALVFGLWRRAIVAGIDWTLLLIFVFMFLALRSAADLPVVHAALGRAGLQEPLRAYAAGVVLSQGISNVPAAIMLKEFTGQWRALAYGVNVGGFGLCIGSLANLIALRLAATRGIWLKFHLISLPFLVIAAALGWWLL